MKYLPHNLKITGCMMVLLCGSMLTACAPEKDMQGVDPRDYYTQHPIKNTVETKTASQNLHFDADENRLDETQLMRLKRALNGISPMAADNVMVQLSARDASRDERKRHLIAVLRSMGYGRDKIVFESSDAMSAGDARVDVQYAVVIPPNCPDWRTSPVTTYSNSKQGNFGCASTVNLGAMVADPQDLVRGHATVTPDTQRSSKVVELYHGGQLSAAPAAGGASTSGGAPANDAGTTNNNNNSPPDGGGQ